MKKKRLSKTRTAPPTPPEISYKQLTTICWCCENATNDGCSWSRSFIPVEGWEATPTIIQGGFNAKYELIDGKVVRTQLEREIHSYKVHSCPQFKPDVLPQHLGIPQEIIRSFKQTKGGVHNG